MDDKKFYRYASSPIVKLDQIEGVVQRNERIKNAILTANNERMSRQKLRLHQAEDQYKKEIEIKNRKNKIEIYKLIGFLILIVIGFCVAEYFW